MDHERHERDPSQDDFTNWADFMNVLEGGGLIDDEGFPINPEHQVNPPPYDKVKRFTAEELRAQRDAADQHQTDYRDTNG